MSLGLSLAPDLQAAGGAAASGRYLPAIQPLMAWSIALSTLLCYYPLELPISALARVGELFGICRRDHSGRAVRLGRREGRCPVGGSTDSPSDWSGGSGRELRGLGFAEDMQHATQLNVYRAGPVMRGERLESC